MNSREDTERSGVGAINCPQCSWQPIETAPKKYNQYLELYQPAQKPNDFTNFFAAWFKGDEWIAPGMGWFTAAGGRIHKPTHWRRITTPNLGDPPAPVSSA